MYCYLESTKKNCEVLVFLCMIEPSSQPAANPVNWLRKPDLLAPGGS